MLPLPPTSNSHPPLANAQTLQRLRERESDQKWDPELMEERIAAVVVGGPSPPRL
jgi:hypothetical protein